MAVEFSRIIRRTNDGQTAGKDCHTEDIRAQIFYQWTSKYSRIKIADPELSKQLLYEISKPKISHLHDA